MKRSRIRLICALLLYSMLGVLTASLALAWMPLNVKTPLLYTVEPGSSIRQVTRGMAAWKLIPSARLVEVWLRIQGRPIQAGEYLLTPGMTLHQITTHFQSGHIYLHRIVFPAGWTFEQLWRRLSVNEALDQDIAPEAVMTMLGYPEGSSPEGQFYSDTYLFARHTPVSHILIHAHLLLQSHLMQAWITRSPAADILEQPRSLLTLASIVQKEGHVVDELPQIAGVLCARLQQRMRLQADPTVIYALGSRYTGTLSKEDLRIASPWNTYKVAGLPPTPIGLVDDAALYATAHPIINSALYYVARGDGTHVFSDTLEAHQQAIRKYQIRGEG